MIYEEEEPPIEEETFRIPDAQIVSERAGQVLVRVPDTFGGPKWVPTGVIHDDSEIWSTTHCGPGVLVVSMWYAMLHGWSEPAQEAR